MSWSVSGFGKAPAVAAKIAAEISQYKCIEPEEAVKQAVGVALAAALGAQDPRAVVNVTASGHQGQDSGRISNTLKVSVEPVYGFVE
jgi:hypothetical protein